MMSITTTSEKSHPTTIEECLDFILSHLQEPHFPRMISTYLTANNPPWKILVNSKDECIAKFKESNLLDCRISAYPYPVPTVRGINAQEPNFFLSDLDIKDFITLKLLDQYLEKTLQNYKDRLHNARPTVLWSGGGYHLLQPLDADIVLEMESIFSRFNEPPGPSVKIMRYMEKLLTEGKADSQHFSTVSFSNCMIRIPGSYNVKYVQKDDIIATTPQSEVKIVQRWDGYKPNIRWLLRDYHMYLVQEKNNEVLANLYKDQKRIRSRWSRGVGIWPTNNQQPNEIDWIESLYNRGLDDFRRYCIWRVFVPYFINIKGLSQSETRDLVKDWLNKCGLVRRLNFNTKGSIDYALKTVGRFKPATLDDLKAERPLLYTLLKNEEIIY